MKRVSTVPGDKSTFSITPFLNRTASVAPESPMEEERSPCADTDGDTAGQNRTIAQHGQGSPGVEAEPSKQYRRGKLVQGARKVVDPIESNSMETKTRAPPARRPKKAPALDQVVEEDHDGILATKTARIEPQLNEIREAVDDSSEPSDIKKKKRRLLGGTLFDDGNGEVVKGDKSVVRPFGTLARGSLGASKANQRLISTTRARGFDAFSPLKKDRKG